MPNSDSPDRFPDLYKLLSLQPLESDAAAIASALQSMSDRAQSASTDAKQAQRAKRAKRLVELGRLHLLSGDRKLAYDQRWEQVHGRAQATGRRQATWDYCHFEPLLPKASPQEPFDLGAYLQAGFNRDVGQFDAEFAKLQSLLAIATQSQPIQTTAHSADSWLAPPIVSLRHPMGKSSTPSPVSRKIRRRRQHSMFKVMFTVLTCLLVLLVLNLLLPSWLTKSTPPSSVATQNNGSGSAAQHSTDEAASARPRRSGLPSVQGLGAGAGATGEEVESVPLTSVMPSDISRNEQADQTPKNDFPGVPVMPMDTPPPFGAPETMAMPAPAMDIPLIGESRVPVPSIGLTDEEKATWFELLTQARQLIGEQKYQLAKEKTGTARSLAKSETQLAQLGRLEAAQILASDLQTAMVRAIAGLGAGESFLIGTSTQASFVEGDSTHLVVRIRGQNQSFTLTELPVGLAFAVADLKMPDSPTSKACKAAFTLFHPGAASNDLALQRARTLMSEAISSGSVPDDMLSIFTDEYELPQ